MSGQQGDTPLMMATKQGIFAAVKLLLDRSVDSSCKDKVINLRSK